MTRKYTKTIGLLLVAMLTLTTANAQSEWWGEFFTVQEYDDAISEAQRQISDLELDKIQLEAEEIDAQNEADAAHQTYHGFLQNNAADIQKYRDNIHKYKDAIEELQELEAEHGGQFACNSAPVPQVLIDARNKVQNLANIIEPIQGTYDTHMNLKKDWINAQLAANAIGGQIVAINDQIETLRQLIDIWVGEKQDLIDFNNN